MKALHRPIKRKKFRRWHLVVMIIVLLVSIVGTSLVMRRIARFSEAQQTVPLPTGMDPNFMTAVNDCFIPTAAVYGYTLRITAGFRSVAEQNELYQQGRTTDGHIVTEAAPYRSIHNYGFAVDVVDRWKGYNIDWDKLIKIGTYCGLESGGTGDLPHFEHRGGLSTADFQAGKRPAPISLPCPSMVVRADTNVPLTLKDLEACNAPTF